MSAIPTRRIACCLGAVLLGVVTTGCYRKPDTLGHPCRAEDDCNDMQVCEQDLCVGPPEPPATTTGAEPACPDTDTDTDTDTGTCDTASSGATSTDGSMSSTSGVATGSSATD